MSHEGYTRGQQYGVTVHALHNTRHFVEFAFLLVHVRFLVSARARLVEKCFFLVYTPTITCKLGQHDSKINNAGKKQGMAKVILNSYLAQLPAHAKPSSRVFMPAITIACYARDAES